MQITSNNEKYIYDFCQIAKQFFPLELFNDKEKLNEINVQHTELLFSSFVIELIEITKNSNEKTFVFNKKYYLGKLGLEAKKELTRYALISFYEAFCKFTHKKLDWGCLTGVRPTKIGYEFLKQTENFNTIKKLLNKHYFLNKNKSQLICEIIKNQNFVRNANNSIQNTAIFYINIPFCTSKCSYCSFVSAVIGKCQELVEPFVEKLCYEIKEAKKIIKDNNIKIKSVYIGGGTPTSLTAFQLEKILSLCNFGQTEWTVEAGRPDTIDEEKLNLLKKYGVNRISINPQTFNQKVLDEIGRKHTVEDVILKYNIAKKLGFSINMDLIAGLPKDSYKSFKKSVIKAISLEPNNITIHTLALKTKADLIKDEVFCKQNIETKKMVLYSVKKLKKNNYTPYYLYRQKNMIDNQENVGWSKPNSFCSFNIDSMEDFENVIACGANAISKRIFKNENRIERFECPKDILTYINKINILVKNKYDFFKTINK